MRKWSDAKYTCLSGGYLYFFDDKLDQQASSYFYIKKAEVFDLANHPDFQDIEYGFIVRRGDKEIILKCSTLKRRIGWTKVLKSEIAKFMMTNLKAREIYQT